MVLPTHPPQHLPASFQLATHLHSETTQVKHCVTAVSFHARPETLALLNADTSVVCLVTVIILKIPLFSLLEMKSCSCKSDLQNTVKFHSQLKGPWKALRSSMAKLTTHPIPSEIMTALPDFKRVIHVHRKTEYNTMLVWQLKAIH